MNEFAPVCFPEPERVISVSDLERLLELVVPKQLAYVNGHFNQLAIVPGVTQIHWAVHYARLYFGNTDQPVSTEKSANHSPGTPLLSGFYQMQAVKFKSLMIPECAVFLELRLSDNHQKLYFRFYADDQEFSSGRLYFKNHVN